MKKQVFMLTSALILLAGCDSTGTGEKIETAGTPVSTPVTPSSGTGETSAPVTPSSRIAGTTAPISKPVELPSVTSVSSIPAKPPTQEEKGKSGTLADGSGSIAGDGMTAFDFKAGDGFQFYLENKGAQRLFYRVIYPGGQNLVERTILQPGESHSFTFQKSSQDLPGVHGVYTVYMYNDDGSTIDYALVVRILHL
ncbi:MULTISPECIES: hypothetical protein [unclassified Paenibacillus]|uniref:hypothetical protein n=1 Tax=unclassified Paenibacillus TaxID=185978 RepID=UPI00020D72D7|nr:MULTISPECIES: hypothetical protein [unclassified Paenibacillus]EGL15768.1 hypothetical protein HMPREF9413_5163 [Paenibacillus sp. HGF7]EPD88241.1 hypothetical protein HMPREF1207_02415 [Paenibacillus sp. HGH0039]